MDFVFKNNGTFISFPEKIKNVVFLLKGGFKKKKKKSGLFVTPVNRDDLSLKKNKLTVISLLVWRNNLFQVAKEV